MQTAYYLLLTAYSVIQSAGLEVALLFMHFNHFAIFGHKTSQFVVLFLLEMAKSLNGIPEMMQFF